MINIKFELIEDSTDDGPWCDPAMWASPSNPKPASCGAFATYVITPPPFMVGLPLSTISCDRHVSDFVARVFDRD